MAITVDATYENGSLKLSEPLPLKEHEKVRVTVEAQGGLMGSGGAEAPLVGPTLGEWIASLSRDLPPEAFEGLPTDGASQHDHYIYGTAKKCLRRY